MDESKQRKIGALLSYLSIILGNTVSIIYTPYMLQMLGQSEYGLMGTASSYISYLSLFSLGVGGAYIRYNVMYRARNDKEGEYKLNGMFLIIFAVLSFFVLIGGICIIILCKSFLKESFMSHEILKLQLIMASMILNTIFTFIFTVVVMALHAYEKHIFLRTIQLISGLIVPFINIIILLNGGKSIALSISTLSVAIITYLMYFMYAKKSIGMRFHFYGFDYVVLKDILTFSMFLFINSLTDQLTNATDNVILSKLYGTSAVAIYTVGSGFKTYFLSFSTSISSVFAAKVNMISAKDNDDVKLTDLMIRVGRIQCIITSLILIGFASLGYDFIKIWAGKEYVDSFYIALLLLLSIYVPCFQNVGIEIQKAKNKHKVRSIVYFIIAVINIIISIPLAIKWNGIGAAFATFVCLISGNTIFMNIYYQKGIGLDMNKFWREIFKLYPGMVPAILVSIIINMCFSIKSIFEILLYALIITIFYICGLWLFSLNADEKNILKVRVKLR